MDVSRQREYSASPGSGIDPRQPVTRIMVMAKVLPLSEVKAKLSEVVDQIVATHERVTVTRNGRPVAVLLSTDDLEAIEETLAVLSDPAAMRQLDAGRAAIAAGDIATKDDIEALRDRLRATVT
jgi:antitoxin YefM